MTRIRIRIGIKSNLWYIIYIIIFFGACAVKTRRTWCAGWDWAAWVHRMTTAVAALGRRIVSIIERIFGFWIYCG
jgi:hypothetical protein